MTTNDDVSKVLEQLLVRLDDLNDMRVQIGVMNTQLAQVIESQHETNKAIQGNGKPGLNDRVARLESSFAEHVQHCPSAAVVDELKKDKELRDEEREEEERSKRSLKSSLVLLGITTVLNAVLSVLNFH